MSVDILIIIIAVLAAIFGYKKGIIVSTINLLVLFVFFYFAQSIIDFFSETFPNIQLFSDLNTNATFRYIFLGIVSIIIILFTTGIFKRIVNNTFLSLFDRLGGIIIGLGIVYLLVCFLSVSINSIDGFIEMDPLFKDSFFISKQFNEYNVIYRWWYGE